jgi:CubicO group peptidase (beta-lactamase class C family)
VLIHCTVSAAIQHDVPTTTDTMFDAGSVSKRFTAAAVVRSARAGKLSLDDSVRKYVPELPDFGVPLTIRHLLHYTSGLRLGQSGWSRGPSTSLLARDGPIQTLATTARRSPCRGWAGRTTPASSNIGQLPVAIVGDMRLVSI